MRIGIDVGISSTKIAVIHQGQIVKVELWESGGFDEKRLKALLSTLDQEPEGYSVTGVGSDVIGDTLSGKPVVHVAEFAANAQATRNFMSDTPSIAVSIGTGTSFVYVDPETYRHLGGSALGGGTLKGLMAGLLPHLTFKQSLILAQEGDLSHIDLQIGEVCTEAIPNLPMDTTASNLFKFSEQNTNSDIAAGIINLVLQNIGVMAHLAGAGLGIKDFVVIGRLAGIPIARTIFDRLERLYGIRFYCPSEPAFMTALGAAMTIG